MVVRGGWEGVSEGGFVVGGLVVGVVGCVVWWLVVGVSGLMRVVVYHFV